MDKNEEGTQEFKNEGKIFAERPISPDASTGKLTFRYAVTFGPTIVLGYWFWLQRIDITEVIVISTFVAVLGAFAFGYDFFGWHVIGLGRWRRIIPDLHRTEYFTWVKRPDILGTRSPNGRRLILSKMFKVTVLPTNLRGNFLMFVKQLTSARVPFSFQVVHAPTIANMKGVDSSLPNGLRPRDWRTFPVESIATWDTPAGSEHKWITSVIFSTTINTRGYLLAHVEIRKLRRQLDAQAASLQAAFSSNYHHAKLEVIQKVDLARATQGLFPGPVTQSPKRFTPRAHPADLVKIGFAIIWTFFSWILCHTYLPSLLGVVCFTLILFAIIVGTIPSLWPVAFGAGQVTYYNPWAGQSFYSLRRRARTSRGILCVREGTRIASFGGMAVFGHVSLQGYADPTKWFRSVLATNLPVLYQWEAKPVTFDKLGSIAGSYLLSDSIAQKMTDEVPADQETFLSYWGGFWLVNGIIGTRHDYHLPELLVPETFHESRRQCTKQLRELCALTLNTFRDCGLVRLRAQLARASICIIAGRTIDAWETGSGICQFLMAGTTFAPYVQLWPDLKRGLDTCIPAEFNTPMNLDNYVVLGNALNTEVLEEEGPVGLSEQCLSSPLAVLGGSPHERAAVIQKVALELLARGEGGIALDSSGAWTGLARATRNSSLWQKISIQVAGQDFWMDPFALARITPGYADALCDAFTLIFAWMSGQREYLFESIFKVDEGSLELNAVTHALEMVLAERSKVQGDSVLTAINTLVAGRNALFFRSGAANLPAGSWARSNSLIILDFSPLPEPQQSVARVATYLYLALLAKAGQLSTRVYFDDAEQIVTRIKHTNLHLERFAQHFALGNLPLVAGIGRPFNVYPSFLELFNAAICLQVRNKGDLKTIAELMAMDDKAEGGMYSEHRKSSYQIEFVQQLRPGWAVIKRSDRPEPFPVVLHLEEIARLVPIKPADARAESSPMLLPLDTNTETPEEGTATTLIEHDLGPLAGLSPEVLSFLQAAASAQDLNGGPVSHKLLADQLLYKLQPAFFKFKLSERGAADVRNRLLDALAAADYLRATYRKAPGGGETGATCYEVTPKYLEAQEDALNNGSPTLKGKVATQGGTLAGVAFTGTGTEPPIPKSQVTPGTLDDAFTKTLLPGLAAARVALLSGNLDDAAAKAELAWARFLARSIGRNPEDAIEFDADELARTLTTFPEWPFDIEESRVLWDAFKPGAWEHLDVAALDRKINKLTAFQEQYQLRNASIQK